MADISKFEVKQRFSRHRKRVRLINATLLLGVTATVYLLHPWYHDQFGPNINLSHQTIDTAGIIVILVCFIIAQRLASMVSARQACEQLLQDALDDGGTDNISIVVGRAVRRRKSA